MKKLSLALKAPTLLTFWLYYTEAQQRCVPEQWYEIVRHGRLRLPVGMTKAPWRPTCLMGLLYTTARATGATR